MIAPRTMTRNTTRTATPTANGKTPLRTVSCAVLFGILLITAAPAKSAVLWVGQKAPAFSFEKYLNAPADTPLDLTDFAGQVVVIEFFSTTCPNCQAAMPHYNELARSMHDQPVTFISLSNEAEPDVRAFMQSYGMSALVALDTDYSMWRDYSVLGVPLAVVINTEGVISALTHPNNLNESVIRDVLAGRTPALPPSVLMQDGTASDHQANKALPLMQIEVRPAKPGDRTALWKGEEFRARAATLADLLGTSLNIEPHLFVSDDILLDARYDVTITPPNRDPKLIDAMLSSVLEQMIQPRLKKEPRTVPSYVLRSRSAGAMSLQPGGAEKASFTGTAGNVKAINITLSQLIRNVQHELKAPVLDETGLTGGYNFDLTWDVNKPESIVQALRDQLGLDVRTEPRTMDVYVVRRGS